MDNRLLCVHFDSFLLANATHVLNNPAYFKTSNDIVYLHWDSEVIDSNPIRLNVIYFSVFELINLLSCTVAIVVTFYTLRRLIWAKAREY